MANLGPFRLATVDVIAQMPRCSTCRFWSRDLRPSSKWDVYLDEDEAYCLTTILGSHFTVHGPQNPKGEASLAHVMDDEGYAAALVTDADFGCVQWEPKPDV